MTDLVIFQLKTPLFQLGILLYIDIYNEILLS